MKGGNEKDILRKKEEKTENNNMLYVLISVLLIILALSQDTLTSVLSIIASVLWGTYLISRFYL